MQITADVSKVLKTVPADFTFILNVLSESTILPKKNVISFI